MKYQVLWAESMVDLENRVNAFLKEGWRPQGGLAIVARGGGQSNLYYQALIKPEGPREEPA